TPLLAAEVARSSLAFIQQIRKGQAAGTPVALHVPVPMAALSMAAGRYALLHRLRDLPTDVRRLLLVELADVPDGTPQARLGEAAGRLGARRPGSGRASTLSALWRAGTHPSLWRI